MTTSLRSILFTDMVGSTEQRARLGEDRADELRRDHDDLLARCIATHEGRILRWTGDGVKADFATASAAVSAALDIQRAVARYARSARAVADFALRIGLAVGEVSFDDDDIHGVAVIEAARLERLARPGEVWCTDLVGRLGARRVDAEFESVGERILKGLDDPVSVVRIVDTRTAANARPMARAVLGDRRFPMVGRDEDVLSALASWEDVSAGLTRVVLVTGQAGLGKSRLIAHLADHAHAAGAMVLAGVCDSDLDVPYQPFAMAFDEVRSVDDDLALAIADGAGPLGPLFPSRRQQRGGSGPSARFDLFDAVVKLLERLTQDQPVVVVLEDLHWATPPTVQLLRHVVRYATGARVLVLASYRAEEISPGHPLNELLAEIRPGTAVSRIDLRPLDPDDVADLVRERVDDSLGDHVSAFAARVCDEGAGNPFFVCELLHHLATTGELERLVQGDPSGRFAIPDSVRDIVGQRIGRLGTTSAELLQVAAIIGQTFDVEVLAAVVDQEAEDVLDLLEAAERIALVSESAAGRFGFAHAIVRTTLLETSSATRARLLHRRIAEAIDRLLPDEHDELARHWFGAGVDDKGNEHLELAARRDLEALAYESAADRYRALINYHRGHDDLAPAARAWLGLGLAQRGMGLVVYREAIDEAGRLARRQRDPDLLADTAIASIWPGTMFPVAGATDTGMVELCEDALDLIAGDDPRRVRILSTLASHLTFESDRSRRSAILDEAHTLARADGRPDLVGNVLVAEYLSLWDPTTSDRRARIAVEVARAARATGDADLTFFGGFFEAIGLAERCDVASARNVLEHLSAAADATHNFYFRFLVERFLLSLDILAGRGDAQAGVDALAAEYGDTHADTAGTWSIQTGGIAIQAGRLGALAPALAAMTEESSVGANWTGAYGLALALAGDRDGAMAVLDRLDPPPLDYFWLVTTQCIAELVVELGRTDLAASLRASLDPFRDHLGISASGSLCLGLVRTSLGQLAHLLGDHASAIDLLEDAIAVADRMGAPYEATKARRALVAARLGSGASADEVAGIIERARSTAVEFGFEDELARLDRLANAIDA